VALGSITRDVITWIHGCASLRLLPRRNILYLNQRLMRWLGINLNISLVAHESGIRGLFIKLLIFCAVFLEIMRCVTKHRVHVDKDDVLCAAI
jgi:hypothetical protein